MKENNPVMLLIPINKARSLGGKFIFLGEMLSKIIYSLPYDIKDAEINIDAERYALASLYSAIIYFFIFGFVGAMFGIVITREIDSLTIILGIILGLAGFFAMLFLHLITPKILAAQLAKMVEEDLLFALRTLLIQLSSGISLFESMRAISKSNYGQVSKEFSLVVRDITSGMSEGDALEKLAFKTKSEILKKVVWQMVTTMKSGGSIVNSLSSAVTELVNQQREIIQNYSAELNLWTLIYLIIAAAMPSLGVTFLVIASSIGSSGIGKDSVILIAFLAVCIQVAMIMIIRTQVPKVIK